MKHKWIAVGLACACLVGACTKAPEPTAAAAPVVPPQRQLGIRPQGDEEIKPDMSRITSDELKKVFTYIDEHVDDHVRNLQKWLQQPSISNTGEGMQESAEMVKGFFD